MSLSHKATYSKTPRHFCDARKGVRASTNKVPSGDGCFLFGKETVLPEFLCVYEYHFTHQKRKRQLPEHTASLR